MTAMSNGESAVKSAVEAPSRRRTGACAEDTLAHGIGAPLARLEDPRLLTGNGRFADDINRPGQAWGYVLRSPVAHAIIKRIDVSAALEVSGLHAVLTGDDYHADGLGDIPCVSIPPTITGKTYHATPFPPLEAQRVLAVGTGVAFVVAETLAAAIDAAECIVVEYEPLPAAPTVEAAIADGAPLVWPEATGNRCFVHELGDAAATERAFTQADHVVSARVRSQRVAGNPLEPRTCIGEYQEGDQRWSLVTSTSNPHRIRLLLAEHIFRVPAHRLHVVAGDVGGGFGTKGGLYPEEILVLWAAQRIGRPVKWVCDRSEAFLSDFNGRDQVADAELALRKDGTVLGMRVELNHNLGCQLGPSTAHPPLVGARMLSGVYAFPAMHVTINGIFTHSRTFTTYRGAGRPEAALVVERMMDLAAADLGIDPVEIRRRNFIAPQQMPYRTAIGESYDCGEFEAVMDDALKLADWGGFESRKAVSAARGLLRGRGLSCYIEVCATISERMELRFDATGGLAILAGNGGLAGFAKGSAEVELLEEGEAREHTRLKYRAQAQIGGKLAQIGSRLVDATAAKMSAQFFDRLTQVITTPAGAPAAAEAAALAAAPPGNVAALVAVQATLGMVTIQMPAWAWAFTMAALTALAALIGLLAIN